MKKLIAQTAKKELMKSGMSERQADLQLASLAHALIRATRQQSRGYRGVESA